MTTSEAMSQELLEHRPAGIRMSTAYSLELESLRGWAILLVFLFHTVAGVVDQPTFDLVPTPFLAFITAGHTGVTLFFVLSAYLLSGPFLEEGWGGRPVRWGDFFRRRVLRIMPLYSVAVIVSLIFCFDQAGVFSEALRALFFVNSFAGDSVVIHALLPYSSVWWSLGTEAQFYVALPFLGLCLRSKMGRIAGLMVLLGWAVLYWRVTSDQTLMTSEAGLRFSLGLPGRAPAFLAGIAAAWLVSRHGERIRGAFRKPAWLRNGGADLMLFCVLLMLGILLQKVSHLGFMHTERFWPNWHLAESGLWGLIVLLVVVAPIRIRPLVSNRMFAGLGVLSYSLYLLHVPIMFRTVVYLSLRGVPFRESLVAQAATVTGIFAICLVLSALTYRFIERPFLLRKERIDRAGPADGSSRVRRPDTSAELGADLGGSRSG